LHKSKQTKQKTRQKQSTIMGNSFFSNVRNIVGNDMAAYYTTTGFDPSSVDGVASSCIAAFEDGPVVGYSSVPLRLGALLDNALADEKFKSQGIYTMNSLGCVQDGDDILRCDWNNLYARIVTECQIANIRGVVQASLGYYLEGDCEELLGISPEIIADGILDPVSEWCPSYYDGQEGTTVFASINVVRSRGNGSAYYSDKISSLVDMTLGSGSSTSRVIIDNVPYCTAFDSCTEDDFFTMLNAEAQAYSTAFAENAEYYGNVAVTIVPDNSASDCDDSELKFDFKGSGINPSKTCKWASQNVNRCKKVSAQKHCPSTCGTCVENACIDSPKAKFVIDNKQYTCADVVESPDMCDLGGVKTTCRATCGYCE
jgi:hypothetical protein